MRVLTRRPPPRPTAGVEHRPIDLTPGDGLRAALAGVDAVVDASNRAGTGRAAAARTYAGRTEARIVDVDGMPGILMVGREDRQVSVIAFTFDDGRITTIQIQRNPHKLAHVAPGGWSA